jgi:hypothetical protein
VVGLTLHNTNTNEALVHEQAGNDTQNEEPAESGHRTVGACGGSAPATNTTERAGSRIPRTQLAPSSVGPEGLEPSLSRT